MKLPCLRAGKLLSQRAQGLSAHEGLRLEEHLVSCDSCRAQSNLLRELTMLSSHIPKTLDDRARERAIANAFGAREQARVLASASHTARPLLLGAAALALAVASVILLPRLGWKRPEPPAAPVIAARSDRVLSGSVELAGSVRGVGQELSEHAALRSTEGAWLALAHANVELRPQTEASWDASTRRLRLERGSVMVDVDPALHRSFSVQTARFTVQVLGTRFVVSERGVYVQRGRVAVETPEHPGAPVILTAGTAQTQFVLPSPAEPPLAEPGDTNAVPRAVPPRKRHSGDAHATPPTAAESGGRTALDVKALLEEARAQLAAREIPAARRTLELAAPKLKKPALRAEALSLEAEASLLEGRFQAARDTYLRVAEAFPRLAAAETALFAAARVEAEHGEPARARGLFSNYLARYPNGSYRKEAERRLQATPVSSAAEPAR